MPEDRQEKGSESAPLDDGDLERQWTTRLRTPVASPRVAAMAADAGLSCVFWSIVQASGLPFAEIALPAGTEQEAVPIQLGTFRIVADSPDLARAAAGFRARAIKEFSLAPGLPVAVRLYLPWFCVLPSVEAMGSPLAASLERAELPSNRVIVEVPVPAEHELAELTTRANQLRDAGLLVSLRVEELGPGAVATASAPVPDFVHLVDAPSSFQAALEVKTFLDGVTAQSARVIVGNVRGPGDAAHVEGLGVTLFYGESISAPRFLC
jgi:hypothetical protein